MLLQLWSMSLLGHGLPLYTIIVIMCCTHFCRRRMLTVTCFTLSCLISFLVLVATAIAAVLSNHRYCHGHANALLSTHRHCHGKLEIMVSCSCLHCKSNRISLVCLMTGTFVSNAIVSVIAVHTETADRLPD